MLEVILPAGVESQECFGDSPGGVLFREEEQVIAHAVASRRRDYATVRSCAGRAWRGWVTRRFRSCPVWVVHPPGRPESGAA